MQSQRIMQTFKWQALVGLLVVAVFATQSMLLSALYGFFVGIANVAMLGFGFDKANKKAAENPKTGILFLYMSAVIRFILLAVLFVLGMSLLKLEPTAIVLTFVAMQIAQGFNLIGKRRLTD